MKNLTLLFKNAFDLKNKNFNSQKWKEAFNSLVMKQTQLQYLWNEDEDIWMKIGFNDYPLIMANRDLPICFSMN